MKPVAIIHTNAKQMLGALVSAHSYRRNSRNPDAFDVRILRAEDCPELQVRGKTFLRGGHVREWDPDDLQSFTPLRYSIPDLVDHQGLALVTDPDVFAVGDVGELFTRDLQGKAIWCRPRPGYDTITDPLATSVMLLDCAKLPHWRFRENLKALWEHRLDYLDWINLKRSIAAQSRAIRSRRKSGSATSARTRWNSSTGIAAICGRPSRQRQKPPDALRHQFGIIGRAAGLRLFQRAAESFIPQSHPEET